VRSHISHHIAERLELRGISLEDVKMVIQYGESELAPGKGKHEGRLKKFHKTVESKTLTVIAEIYREEYWLITAYEN